MKILQAIVFPLWGSGSGTYARQLSEHLVKLGHEVLVVAPEKRRLPSFKIAQVKPPFYVAFTNHPEWPNAKRYIDLNNKELSMQYLTYFNAILEAVETFKPDVLHIHHCSILTWIASYIKGIYGINYIISSHGTGVMTAEVDTRYLALTRDALTRAEFIVPVSGSTKQWLLKVFGRRFAWKTKVITGGINLSGISKNLNLEAFNKKHQLANKNVVLFSGKLIKNKGVEYLIKAAPKIKGEIFIIGDGEEKARLEELAKTLDVQKKIHFLGYFDKNKTEELFRWYQRADVAVFPSIWDEPLGLVVLEALACGTPVVASKKGGIPLAVKNGYNGFLVRARSHKEIAKAVNKILENPALRAKMSENAATLVKERFDWLNIAKQFEKLYEIAHKKAQGSRQARKLLKEQKKRELEKHKLEIFKNKLNI